MRLHDLFDHQARTRPNAEFVVQGGRAFTYGEGLVRVNRLANAFVAAGLRRGDRVGVVAKNCIEFVETYFAASKAGVVPVPVSYRLTPGEWAYALRDSGARLVLGGAGFQDGLSRMRPELPGVDHWIAIGGDAMPGFTPFDAFVAPHGTSAPDVAVSPSDDVYQMYTSGTTGRPKGAVVSHANITANVLQFTHALGALSGARALTVAPLFHVASALIAFCTVSWGSALYLQEDFSPKEVLRALSEERIGFTILVPAMIQACLAAVPAAGPRGYSHLTHLLYGGSPIAESTLRRAAEVFQCELVGGFGMTETSGVNCVMSPADHRAALEGRRELLASAGRPTMGTDVRIAGPDGAPVPAGTLGEIEIRGPQTMRGYWKLPDATRDAFNGEWFRTGDAGRLDEEGYVYVCDRIKDMILSGGENVYPREVEDVLAQHPSVLDVAVIAVPDVTWGEAVKAVVVRRPGTTADAEELIEHCRERLAGFKRPRSVDFIDALPRNAGGKVLKRALREPYWAGNERRVGGA